MIRVKATGLPRGYNNFLLTLSVAFFAVASPRFTPDLGWWAPVAMGAIYHAVRMIMVIGNDMEDPFGTASVTDLPAEMYCDAIARQVKAVYDRKIILSYNLGSGPVYLKQSMKKVPKSGTENKTQCTANNKHGSFETKEPVTNKSIKVAFRILGES